MPSAASAPRRRTTYPLDVRCVVPEQHGEVLGLVPGEPDDGRAPGRSLRSGAPVGRHCAVLEDMTKSTMRGITQDVLGGPEVLRESELERPEPGVSQILIRVHAAGVNPTDWKHRAHRIFLGSPPFVLGWDVSGVVEATGFGVTLFRPGDEVFGMLALPARRRRARRVRHRPAPRVRAQARRHRPRPGGRAPAGEPDRLAGAGRHRAPGGRAAGARPRRRRRGRPRRGADRQGPGGVRDRHGQRGQPRASCAAWAPTS